MFGLLTRILAEKLFVLQNTLAGPFCEQEVALWHKVSRCYIVRVKQVAKPHQPAGKAKMN